MACPSKCPSKYPWHQVGLQFWAEPCFSWPPPLEAGQGKPRLMQVVFLVSLSWPWALVVVLPHPSAPQVPLQGFAA